MQQEVEQKQVVQGRTVVSFTKPTPTWATWTFRIVFLLTTAATIVIAADPAIPDDLKVRIGVYLKALDVVIWGMARGIGIDKSNYQEEA